MGFVLVKFIGKKMVFKWKFCSGNSNFSKVYMLVKIVREKFFELVNWVISSLFFLELFEGSNFCVEVVDDDDGF